MQSFRPYLGIPFKAHGRATSGVDCWGLVCLYYAREFGLALPSYEGLASDVNNPLSVALVMGAVDRSDWLETDDPQEGDVMLFGSHIAPYHVGLFINEEIMLHTRCGTDTTIERWVGPLWEKRLLGVYRHHDR